MVETYSPREWDFSLQGTTATISPRVSSAMRCMGCQPAKARTDCESSSADRNSCEMNGLYLSPKAECWASAVDEQGAAVPFPPSGQDGLAQASHASAATSPMEFVTRSVSSIMRPRLRTSASLTPTVPAIDSSCPAPGSGLRPARV